MAKLALSNFNQDIATIQPLIFQPESEHSWEAIARAITRLGELYRASSPSLTLEIVANTRNFSRPLNSAMNSERTRLSGAALDLVALLASTLGSSFEPLLPSFMPTLLALCARTNKVFVTRARACLLTTIEATQLPSILPYLLHQLQEKSASARLIAMEAVLACMNCFNPPDLENEGRAQLIEMALRKTARDSSAEVRRVTRKVFDAYKVLLPGRVEKFTAPLSPVTKKYLDISIKPVPVLHTSTASTSRGQRETGLVIAPRGTRSGQGKPSMLDLGQSVGPARPQTHDPLLSTQAPGSLQPPPLQNRKRTTSAPALPGAHLRNPRPTAMSTTHAPSSQTELARRLPQQVLPHNPLHHSDSDPVAKLNRQMREVGINDQAVPRRVPLNLLPPSSDQGGSTEVGRQGRINIGEKDVTTNPSTHGEKGESSRVISKLVKKPSAPVIPTSNSLKSHRTSEKKETTKAPQKKSALPSKNLPKRRPNEAKASDTKPITSRSAPTEHSGTQPLRIARPNAEKKAELDASLKASTSSTRPSTPSLPVTSAQKEISADARSQVDLDETEGHPSEELDHEPSQDVPINVMNTPPRADSAFTRPMQTPISSLLSSIQQGFLSTPAGPLSPPQSYLFTSRPHTESAFLFGHQLRKMEIASDEDGESLQS